MYIRKIFFGALSIGCLSLGLHHLTYAPQVPVVGSGIPGYHSLAGEPLSDMPAQAFLRTDREPALRYTARISSMVHLATYHCDPRDFRFSLISKVVELWMSTTVNFDWDQGLLESPVCGYCHQRAIVVANILRENGMDDAWAYSLNGHVVTRFTDEDGNAYLVDPDYGAGPFLYDSADEDLERDMRAVYQSAVFDNTDVLIDMVLSRKDNSPYVTAEHFDEVIENRKVLYGVADGLAYLMLAIGLFFGGVVWRNG